MSQSVREAFEKWVRTQDEETEIVRVGDEYKSDLVQAVWDCWQAARAEAFRECAALVLPPIEPINDTDWKVGYKAGWTDYAAAILAKLSEAEPAAYGSWSKHCQNMCFKRGYCPMADQ